VGMCVPSTTEGYSFPRHSDAGTGVVSQKQSSGSSLEHGQEVPRFPGTGLCSASGTDFGEDSPPTGTLRKSWLQNIPRMPERPSPLG
jgi:hypothetical protein